MSRQSAVILYHMKEDQATHLVVLPTSWLLADPLLLFFSRLYKQFCIFPLSGTNWVDQILSDLVATFEKKTQDEENVNDEDLEEFPYLEVGDTGKYEVGTEYLLKL